MTTPGIIWPRNILVVEDEMLIALDIELMLIEMGHKIAAVCTRVPAAIVAAHDEKINFAVLDINISGSESFPVARVLRERNVPFLFLSGYGVQGLIDEFSGSAVVTKPFNKSILEAKIWAGSTIGTTA